MVVLVIYRSSKLVLPYEQIQGFFFFFKKKKHYQSSLFKRELIGGCINSRHIHDAYWKVIKVTKMLGWWVPYNYCYFCSIFFFKNLPAYALFTLVSFVKKKKILPAWIVHTLVSFVKKKKMKLTSVKFCKKKKKKTTYQRE